MLVGPALATEGKKSQGTVVFLALTLPTLPDD